jgi:hypothetical protein
MALSESITEKYQVGENIFYFENDILCVFGVGDCDEKLALGVKDVMMEIHKTRSEIRTLVDMNQAGKSSPEARKIWKDLMDHKNMVKIAFVGVHMVARVIAEFLILFSGSKRSRFFSNREEAMKWLTNDSI